MLHAQEKINQLDANGDRTGIWKKYFNNNRIRYEGQFDAGKEIVRGLLEAQREHDEDDAELSKNANKRATFGRQDAYIGEHAAKEQKVQNRRHACRLCQYDGAEYGCPDDR